MRFAGRKAGCRAALMVGPLVLSACFGSGSPAGPDAASDGPSTDGAEDMGALPPDAPTGLDSGSSNDAANETGDATVDAATVDLGFVWREVEEAGNCHGTWTRKGVTSSFSSVWPDCGGTTATMIVSIIGTTVTVQRTLDSGGNDCTYTGTLAPDGTTVSGTYHCVRYQPPAPGAWSAIIDRTPSDASTDAPADAGSDRGADVQAETGIDSGYEGDAGDASAGG